MIDLVESGTPVGEKTLWRTPRELLDAVEARYGELHLDCAASHGAEVCEQYLSPAFDALGAAPGRWTDIAAGASRVAAPRLWLNPPWGAGITKRWVDRAVAELPHGPQAIFLLVPHSDAAWWWWGAQHASEVLHLGRVAFLRPNGEQCGQARDWHDLMVLRDHAGWGAPRVLLQKWDWKP